MRLVVGNIFIQFHSCSLQIRQHPFDVFFVCVLLIAVMKIYFFWFDITCQDSVSQPYVQCLFLFFCNIVTQNVFQVGKMTWTVKIIPKKILRCSNDNSYIRYPETEIQSDIASLAASDKYYPFIPPLSIYCISVI